MVRFFKILFVVITLASLAAVFSVFYINRLPESASKALVYNLAPGTAVQAIGNELRDIGAIRNANLFKVMAFLNGSSRKLQAGEYLIPAASTMHDIITILSDGKSIQHRITITEGLTVHEIITLLTQSDVLTGEITDFPKEGFLAPDTYFIRRGTSRQDLLERMQKSQHQILDRLWVKRNKNLPFLTKYEALILASIIEKETSLKAEKPRVAGVFINRIKKKMRLQSDPTVIYGLTRGKFKLERPLTRKDLKHDNLHNTYKVPALPDTPIANPGIDSIAAALSPLNTDELYFVANGSGGHRFAKTLGQHNINVMEFRKTRKK
jgi:UPF0755 protein